MRNAERARREDRPADAHRDLVQAVALCRQAGPRRDLILALKALGQIERDLGRGDAALQLHEEAVALCRAEGDIPLLAHAVRHLGDVHREARRADRAAPCYHEALSIYRGDPQTNPLDLANAIRSLALLAEDTADVDDATRLWAEARDLYAAVDVPQGVHESEERLAGLARRRGP
jgi:tetratricopeptide (TPR) repeat protein